MHTPWTQFRLLYISGKLGPKRDMSALLSSPQLFNMLFDYIRSKGDMQAMFLRHEGFLGAMGAFMSYEKHGLDDLMSHQLVERFPMGAPYTGGNIHGPPLGDLNEKVTSLFYQSLRLF